MANSKRASVSAFTIWSNPSVDRDDPLAGVTVSAQSKEEMLAILKQRLQEVEVRLKPYETPVTDETMKKTIS